MSDAAQAEDVTVSELIAELQRRNAWEVVYVRVDRDLAEKGFLTHPASLVRDGTCTDDSYTVIEALP